MKHYLKFLQFIRQSSVGLLTLGAVLYLDEVSAGATILSIGGLGFAFYSFLAAFKPIHEEPNWELVYPELALAHSSDLEDTLPVNSKSEEDV